MDLGSRTSNHNIIVVSESYNHDTPAHIKSTNPRRSNTLETIIDIQNVTKRYGKIEALRDVSLSLPPGVTGLLGPNGSGKSTLIKALLGLLKPQSGQGRVLDYQWPRDARQIRDAIGYLPEDDCYIAGLQGVESVTLMAQLSGVSGREGLRRSHEMMDFCGFGEERYREVESYSTGMRQKLKFAQALVHDPPLLILDEPTTGLDPDQRFAMLRRISNLAKHHGKSIILSTHILPDVRTVCDQVVILVGGTVRVVDSLQNLSKPASPTISVSVLGDPTAFANRVVAAGMSASVLGASFDEAVDSANATNALSATVRVEGIQPHEASKLWAFAAETDTSIRRLEPAVNSLEQIFMEVASGKRTASDQNRVDQNSLSSTPSEN